MEVVERLELSLSILQTGALPTWLYYHLWWGPKESNLQTQLLQSVKRIAVSDFFKTFFKCGFANLPRSPYLIRKLLLC